MKKLKIKDGFTLIELLAVIVILAIIALIAVPVVMNIIDEANKSAFKDSAYGILKAGELYYSEQQMSLNGIDKDLMFAFPHYLNNLNIKGTIPTQGTMRIKTDGTIALGISNEKYCITKDFDDANIMISEDLENCEFPEIIYENGHLSSKDYCVVNGTCPKGTEIMVQVNESQTYNFYVINGASNELTLIMDRNLGNTVGWSGGTDASVGPVKAIEELKRATNDWIYIPEREYIYSDDGGGNKYENVKTMMRARMLTYAEARNGDNSCSFQSCKPPSYLYGNLGDSDLEQNHSAYWLSATYGTTWGNVLIINSSGKITNVYMLRGSVPAYPASIGVRPVITLSK